MKKFDEQVKAILREAVEKYGTARALSKASGVSAPNISRWLKDRDPRISEIAPILDLMGSKIVPPDPEPDRDICFVVISSYAVRDVDARIALLESAASACPTAFNVHNALGYAWLEKGEKARALDAFHRAIELHPDDKAGYCDLAYAYLSGGEEELAVSYFRRAVEVDASAAADLRADARLASLLPRILS